MCKMVHVLLIVATAVPVKFNQTTYNVIEGGKSVSITLEATTNHIFSFSVTVSSQDGTASECQATALYGQTCVQSFV